MATPYIYTLSVLGDGCSLYLHSERTWWWLLLRSTFWAYLVMATPYIYNLSVLGDGYSLYLHSECIWGWLLLIPTLWTYLVMATPYIYTLSVLGDGYSLYLHSERTWWWLLLISTLWAYLVMATPYIYTFLLLIEEMIVHQQYLTSSRNNIQLCVQSFNLFEQLEIRLIIIDDYDSISSFNTIIIHPCPISGPLYQ